MYGRHATVHSDQAEIWHESVNHTRQFNGGVYRTSLPGFSSSATGEFARIVGVGVKLTFPRSATDGSLSANLEAFYYLI